MRTFEQCEKCGRFMKQIWYQSNDEPDSWQDYWQCSQNHPLTSEGHYA